jgi:gas vesicle protein
MKTFKELVESHSDIKESGKNYLVKFDTFGKPVTVGIDKSLPSVYITSKIDTLFDEIKQDVKDRIDENLEEKKLEKEDIEKVMKAMGIENYTINPDLTVEINKNKAKQGQNAIQMPFKVGNIFGIFWQYIDDLNQFKGYKNDRTI